MALDGLGPGAFELDAELAQEGGVPVIRVGFEQTVGFLVGEQVEDELCGWGLCGAEVWRRRGCGCPRGWARSLLLSDRRAMVLVMWLERCVW